MPEFATIVFYVFSAVMLFAASCVISVKNPVHSALFLVLAFFSASALWMLLKAEFLAIALVLVYVGAVMVLFLFVIMLLNAAQAEASDDPLPWVSSFAIVGGLIVAGVLGYAAFTFKAPKPLEEAAKALQSGTPGPVGEVLFTKFLLPFETVSILLLIAVVGAVALVRRDVPAHDLVLETYDEQAVTVHEDTRVVDGRVVHNG